MRISDWSSDVCSSDLSLDGSIAVWPRLNGAGWTTIGDSLIDTVSLPWLTAAVPTRTAPLITTVPVRALTNTFAGGSEPVPPGVPIFDIRSVEQPDGKECVT